MARMKQLCPTEYTGQCKRLNAGCIGWQSRTLPQGYSSTNHSWHDSPYITDNSSRPPHCLSPLLLPSGPVTLEDCGPTPPPENFGTVPQDMPLHSHSPLLLLSGHSTLEYQGSITPEDITPAHENNRPLIQGPGYPSLLQLIEALVGAWKEGCKKHGCEIHLFTQTKLWTAGTWKFAHSCTFVWIVYPQSFRFFEDFL